jgi:hypothetical protein
MSVTNANVVVLGELGWVTKLLELNDVVGC